MLSFGKGELDNKKVVHAGDMAKCANCGGEHPLNPVIDEHGKEDESLLWYSCGEKTYIGAVDNRLI